jgi:hypothetical protein
MMLFDSMPSVPDAGEVATASPTPAARPAGALTAP